MPDTISRRRLAPIIVLVVAAVLGGLFWVLAGSEADNDTAGVVDSHLLGRAAPSVRSTTLDDEPFDLSRRKGSWVVVNFFNSTCIPCIAEHPELVKFVEQQATLGSDGAEFYTILQAGDRLDNVRDFFEARDGDWPVIRDDDGGINVDFGVAQVPETFIIDPDGIVRMRWAGPIDADTLALLVQQQRDAYGVAVKVMRP
ncbi:MAG: TlpA family protein disulfide reductase [Actinobacteria bacterium]|nr:TlpA family protein disulfide reductase [Actinomycetota bacterium]